MCEIKLSMFLFFSGILSNKKEFTNNYVEKNLTSYKYEELFFNYTKDQEKKIYVHNNNPVILEYYRINFIIGGTLLKEQTFKEIESLDLQVTLEKQKLIRLNKEIDELNHKISKFMDGRNLENSKQKHRLALGGRMRALNFERDRLITEKDELLTQIGGTANTTEKLAQKRSLLAQLETSFKSIKN